MHGVQSTWSFRSAYMKSVPTDKLFYFLICPIDIYFIITHFLLSPTANTDNTGSSLLHIKICPSLLFSLTCLSTQLATLNFSGSFMSVHFPNQMIKSWVGTQDFSSEACSHFSLSTQQALVVVSHWLPDRISAPPPVFTHTIIHYRISCTIPGS